MVYQSRMSIEESAFYECSGLTSLTLPNSLTSIGIDAFSHCSALTSLTLPNSLTSIGTNAFSHCSALTSLTLPNSLTSIGIDAFSDCSGLTSLTLPNSLTSIGHRAFAYCFGLTSLTLPNALTSIGDYAFERCSALENIWMQCLTPIECNPSFTEDVMENCILYVPKGTLADYKNTSPWSDFRNIKEIDFNSIDGIETGNDATLRLSVNDGILTVIGMDSCESITIYDIQGRIVYNGTERTIENLAPGLYIIKAGLKSAEFAI